VYWRAILKVSSQLLPVYLVTPAFSYVVLDLALCKDHFNVRSVQYSFLVCVDQKIFRLFTPFTGYGLHES